MFPLETSLKKVSVEEVVVLKSREMTKGGECNGAEKCINNLLHSRNFSG